MNCTSENGCRSTRKWEVQRNTTQWQTVPTLEYNLCVPINFHLCTETAYELVTQTNITSTLITKTESMNKLYAYVKVWPFTTITCFGTSAPSAGSSYTKLIKHAKIQLESARWLINIWISLWAKSKVVRHLLVHFTMLRRMGVTGEPQSTHPSAL